MCQNILTEFDAEVTSYFTEEDVRKNFSEKTNRSIHLFKVDNFYFPLSFILERTYNKLNQLYFKMEKSVSSSGHIQAHIINNATAKIISEKKSNSSGGEKSHRNNPWELTYQANKNKVSIQITFLAGFLDVLKEMKEA